LTARPLTKEGDCMVKQVLTQQGASSEASTREAIWASPRLQLIVVAFLALTLFLSKSGGTGLANYDDCYYAQKAKEILWTGDWFTMHYNHRPVFDNPPFYMWLVAISFKAMGVSEYAARLPSALMGVLTVLLVFLMASYLFDPWTGFFSALVLATTPTFGKYARHAMMDVTLSFFVCLALFSLLLGLDKNRRYLLLWGLCISVCLLTKSVLGLFPAVISVLFLFATSRARVFFSFHFWVACAIVVFVGCSWYIHQYLHFGRSFVDVHFDWLIVRRGFKMGPEPWFAHLSYLRDLAVYYWPWLPFLGLGIVYFARMARKKVQGAIFVLIWISTFLILASAVQSRRLWYIMPVFPAASIAVGYAVRSLLSPRARLIVAKMVVVGVVFASIVINATPLRIDSEREKDVRLFAPYVRHFAGQHAEVVAYRKDFYGLNNALLFYSDFAASPILEDEAQLRQTLAEPRTVLCIIGSRDLAAVREKIGTFFPVKQGQNDALIANTDLDVSRIEACGLE